MSTATDTRLAPLADPGVEVLADSDWDRWSDRAHALDAAMCVSVGEADWTLGVLDDAAKAAAMIAWAEYREIGALHRRMSIFGKPETSARGVRMLDIEMQTAARIAMSRGISQRSAENWLAEAIAMRDRLPIVGLRLRDGIISPRQFRLIVARTELIDDQDWAPAVDTAIAATLARRARGTWSNKRLIDMVDRIIFRHDPDSVRRRHEKAKASRAVWVNREADGMATLGATMTAQDATIALHNVFRLADMVCPHDRRTPDARRCDALFALLTGLGFECDCGRQDCPATVPDAPALSQWVAHEVGRDITKGRVLVHVIAEQTTVNGLGDEPAFMHGHGVISATHLRDLITREDVKIQHLGLDTDSAPLPTHQPADPYRPSAALDTFIRARDGYCTIPGCDKPADQCDIDHVDEYDHANPAAGGQTTPEGHTIPGPAETNQDLFPGLDNIRWHTPGAGTRPPAGPPPPTSDRTRAKHARRRAEREANRHHRQRRDSLNSDGDPPF
ncbi:DUF222 domain-containing protein [Gordonia sp. (in: high G+C Gram-positive bacteria)]|uniref:DUF222 domain-containing protein n=1 Tax=Gordonia sp. (in: high G+C Gram-positive bacteria) TaxID=84139 RepID=UPI0039E36537